MESIPYILRAVCSGVLEGTWSQRLSKVPLNPELLRGRRSKCSVQSPGAPENVLAMAGQVGAGPFEATELLQELYLKVCMYVSSSYLRVQGCMPLALGDKEGLMALWLDLTWPRGDQPSCSAWESPSFRTESPMSILNKPGCLCMALKTKLSSLLSWTVLQRPSPHQPSSSRPVSSMPLEPVWKSDLLLKNQSLWHGHWLCACSRAMRALCCRPCWHAVPWACHELPHLYMCPLFSVWQLQPLSPACPVLHLKKPPFSEQK